MKISVRLTPGTTKNCVEKVIDLLGNEVYFVRVKARPVEGKANEMLIDVIAKYFGVVKRSVRIVHGLKNRNKVVEILD